MRLLKGLGNAEKFIVVGSAVKSDPASLADEAGAMALFGGARAIWIEPAGEEIVDGVSALLDVAASESAVVAVAGALRKTSGLLKLAESHPAALAHCSYVPEGRDMERVIGDLARAVGPAAVARRRRSASPRRRTATRRSPRPSSRNSRFTSAPLPTRRATSTMTRSTCCRPTPPRATCSARRPRAVGADGRAARRTGRMPGGQQ